MRGLESVRGPGFKVGGFRGFSDPSLGGFLNCAMNVGSLFPCRGSSALLEHCVQVCKSFSEASIHVFLPRSAWARPLLLWEIARAGARWQAHHVELSSACARSRNRTPQPQILNNAGTNKALTLRSPNPKP